MKRATMKRANMVSEFPQSANIGPGREWAMKQGKRHLIPVALLALLIGQAASAQSDTVTVKRDAQLREAPSESAPSLAALPVQTQLTRLAARQGAWVEVRNAQGVTGWVHLFDIGTAPAAQGGNIATGALRGLTSFFGRGNALAPGTRNATSTIGIRGLGAEDIASAQPDPTAVALVETLRLDAAQARQFGNDAALLAQPVDPLPVPPRPPSTTPADQGQPGGRN